MILTWTYPSYGTSTREGCARGVAFTTGPPQPQRSPSAQGEDRLLLAPASAHKPSTKAVQDEQLSWRQVSIAKAGLIQAMTNEPNWPREHVTALATHFLELDNHDLRRVEHGEEALVVYSAEVRREWHEELKSTDDSVQPFDVGMINEERLQRVYNRTLSRKQASMLERSVH
ncbi:hypothetical protein NMY22_g14261 [Coprinellus aureogranulatus]|nr:hypothetical protein NMY22_g14261 [Coprinellus aureogranulatus]